MNDEPLSPGQQVLVEALAELDELELGDHEPAGSFRPTSWAAPAPSFFDLPSLASPADEDAKATEVAQPADEMPAACGSVTEIIAAITERRATAAEIVEAALQRATACNPSINAIVATSPDRARDEAHAVDEVVDAGERPRPLSGVPLLHKDIIATRDIRSAAGSALLRNYVPRADATVVGRLSNAGTLMLGKTNTHEFATGTTGTVSHFGATRNPWDLDHMAGGSSSGSGAALAAGMCAAATGTDTGGSIRIPAACCGIVGLKPTYGRVSRHGVLPFAWGLDHVGPMARRVADVAVLLTAMAGADPFDRTTAAEPATDFSATLGDGVKGLRFAVPEFCFLELAGAPVAAAIREVALVFEELGATRVEATMPESLSLVGPAAIALFLAEGGAVHRRTLNTHRESYCSETAAFLSLADHVSAHAYLQAQRVRALLADEMARVFQSIDVILTPTVAMTAPRLDAREVEGVGGNAHGGSMDVRAAMTLFTRPFNLTGLPALSLPCGFDGGLPIGLQIVGRPFDEATVLRAANAYETANEWHVRRPPGFA